MTFVMLCLIFAYTMYEVASTRSEELTMLGKDFKIILAHTFYLDTDCFHRESCRKLHLLWDLSPLKKALMPEHQ